MAHPEEPTRDGRSALVVVDVQNDFCEGGSLAAAGGADVARRIGEFLDAHAEEYAAVCASRDWHMEPGRHFASSLGRRTEPDYVETWPDHCVAGTPGAEYHPAVAGAVGRHVRAEFRKGKYEAAYSAFEGTLAEDDDETDLLEWLTARGIEQVHVVGIATDFCVRLTALDAVSDGFVTTVLTDLVVGVSAEGSRRALEELERSGVLLRSSVDL